MWVYTAISWLGKIKLVLTFIQGMGRAMFALLRRVFYRLELKRVGTLQILEPVSRTSFSHDIITIQYYFLKQKKQTPLCLVREDEVFG